MYLKKIFTSHITSSHNLTKERLKYLIKISRFQLIILLLLHIILFQITVTTKNSAGDIHFGSLEVHPFLTVEGGYINNINLRRRGEETSSAFMAYKPGINFNWDKTKFRLKLNYLYNIVQYNSDRADNRNDYDLSSGFNYKIGRTGKYFNLNGEYRYLATTEPVTLEEHSERHKDTRYTVNFRMTIKDHFRFEIKPRLMSHIYDDANFSLEKERGVLRDRDILDIDTSLSIAPFSKTWILLQYGYSKMEYKYQGYSIAEDSETNSIFTGIQWDATEKLEGTIKGGYKWRDYIGDNPKNQKRHYPKTWSMEIDLKFSPSSYTSFTLGYERNISDSIYQTDEGYFYSNQISFGIFQNITYKILAELQFNYDFSNYPTTDRRDNLFKTKLNLDYLFKKWIKGKISYAYWNKRTTRENQYSFDYDFSQILLGVDLIF